VRGVSKVELRWLGWMRKTLVLGVLAVRRGRSMYLVYPAMLE
jgi:hypothetical protein